MSNVLTKSHNFRSQTLTTLIFSSTSRVFKLSFSLLRFVVTQNNFREKVNARRKILISFCLPSTCNNYLMKFGVKVIEL